MSTNSAAVMKMRIDRTVAALCKNNYDARYVGDKKELISILDGMLPDGASCSVGGAVTLVECGILDYLKSGRFNYLDRYAENVDGAKIYHEALNCDFYFMSSNAITENGELYNMDGNGNRVAALVYGPKKVIVIAGANKIVKDIDAAVNRKKEIAAPMNAMRLDKDTPCAKTGMCSDCKSAARFCCHELISHYQLNKDRIVVLILPETLGY